MNALPRKLLRDKGWLILIGALLVAFPVGLWAWVPPDARDAACAMERNAAWIGVEWVSEPVDETRVASLAERASEMHLRTLYPYVTYVKPDGTFNPTYDHAGDFVAAFRRHNEETQLLAWIGVPLENDRILGIDGWVDLADPEARCRIADLAQAMVDDAGFDGVHLNVETVQDGNPAYLQLLEEVRAELGPEPVLSVAASSWIPRAVSRLPVVDGYRWSGPTYRAVAARVDQMATMTYDSAMVHPALYRLWMREEVRGITRALVGADVELLIGLSVSREHSLTHRPYAENLRSGLTGFCAGVTRAARPVDGVAIYAAWEAEAADWQHWSDWLAENERDPPDR